MLSLPTKIFSQFYTIYGIYSSFSKFSYRQNLFWSRNLNQICLKVRNFIEKSKKLPSAGGFASGPLCLQWLGDAFHIPRISPFSLTDIDYAYCNLWCRTLWNFKDICDLENLKKGGLNFIFGGLRITLIRICAKYSAKQDLFAKNYEFV